MQGIACQALMIQKETFLLTKIIQGMNKIATNEYYYHK